MKRAVAILAISDSTDNLATLQAALAEALPDATLRSAPDGPRGVALARVELPTLILLDGASAAPDAGEVCRQIRADADLAATPLLVWLPPRGDAARHAALTRRALDAGADGFLATPLDAAELVAQVRAMGRIATGGQAAPEGKSPADDALGQSAARYRTLVETMNDGLALLDKEGRLVYANGRFCQMVGYASDELRGRHHLEVIAPERAAEHEAAIIQRQAGKVSTFETKLRHRSGALVPVLLSGSPVYDREGRFDGTLGVFTDITQRVEAEQRRAEVDQKAALQMAQMDLAQQMARIGYWSFDVASGMPVWSAMMFEVLGCDPAKGVPDYAAHAGFIHPDDWEMFDRAVQGSIAGTPYNIVIRVMHPDGSTHHVATQGHPQVGPDGKIRSLFGTSQDVTERVRADEALRDSEAQFRAIFDASPVPIVFYDERGFPLNANRVCLREMGATDMSQLRDVSIFDSTTIPPDMLAEVQAGRAVRREVAYDREAIWRARGLRSPQQGIRYQDVQITPLEINGQRRYLGQSLDITDRKQAEEALRRREREYATLAENAADMIVRFDRDLRHVYCNAAVERQLGLPIQTLLGKTPLEGGGPREQAEFVCRSLRQALDTGQELVVEQAFPSPLGSRSYQTHIVPEFSAQGQIESLLAFTRDVTDRARAEEALRQERDRAQGYLDTVETIIVALDAEGKVTALNRKGCQILGWSEKEILGQSWFAACLPHPEGMETVYPFFQQLVTGKAEDLEHIENAVVTRSGEVRRIAWHNALLRDAQGRIVGTLSSGDDITERAEAERRRVEAEDEREKLQAQLQQAQKMESVGRLAGGVAHDFNNMLGVILGHAEMSLQQVDPSQPLYADLQEIQKAAQRSADLTRQLLAFARRQTVAPKVLDLNATVDNTLKMLRRLIGEHIDLVWNPGRGVWPIRMDPAQVDQILANLCVNARDAITGAGRITLATDNVTLDAAYSVAHAECVPGEYVLLSVSDTGCGMGPEVLDHLFEPFFTTKGVGQGTGLGLATVYGAVQQNHGCIEAQSVLGESSTFLIYLPRYVRPLEAAAAAIQGADAARTVQRGSETVLLVEDEPAILKMTETMLTRVGYRVLAARTPREALMIAAEEAGGRPVRGKIDLLLTDVMMPEMNGRELAQELMALYPQIQRLFMSGYTRDVIASQGIVPEGVHYIQKPFSLRDLTASVREALDGKPPSRP